LHAPGAVRVAVGVPDAVARPLLNEFGEQRSVAVDALH
jgi:hypothetical protein